MRLKLGSAIKLRLIDKISQKHKEGITAYVPVWQFLIYCHGMGLLTKDCEVRIQVHNFPCKRSLT